MNIFMFIKSRVSILDVIGAYVTLKKAGHYWKSPCPFHSEKTGSFTVSPHKEIFYCFGCHANGDVISFISKIENCTPVEAAKFLAERYQIALPETLSTNDSTDQQKKHYYHVCEVTAQWCHEKLLESPQVLSYIAQRGISAQSVAHFMIGYFPGGLNATKRYIQDLARSNILMQDLVDAHLLSAGKNIMFSPFEERIIFPIKDHLGRFCGFGGRVFKPTDTRAKYYNSHENDFFIKGSLLFGLDLAKKEIQKKETVFLVEGYTDCIAMVQYGYTNTVATLGTACTLEHLKQLSRYATTLYVVYDGDKAGQQAMLRLVQLCWQATIDLKIVILPAGEDPASFLGKGTDLKPLLASASDIFVYFIQTLGTDFTSKGLTAKVQLTRKIIDAVASVGDSLKRDFLLERASQVLGISLDSLNKEMSQTTLKIAPKEPLQAPIAPPAASTLNLPKLEKKIFFAIMNNIQLLNRRNAWYLVTFLPQPLRDIITILDQHKERDPSLDFMQFFDTLTQDQQQFVSRILLEGQQQAEERTFDALLGQLQKNHWKVIVNDIKLKMQRAKQEKNDAQVKELLDEFLQLRKKLIGKELI